MSQRGTYVVEEPYRKLRAVTLDAAISPTSDAIWTNAAGDVSVTMEDDTVAVFTLSASTGLNIAVKKINTTGTTISAAAIFVLNR